MEVKNYREAFRSVRGFAFDVDGVLTNGTMHVNARGAILRDVNSRDACALRVAMQAGYPVAIISDVDETGLARCCELLGFPEFPGFSGLWELRELRVGVKYPIVREKVDALMDFCAERSLLPADILYMGDDILDYGPMRRVGMPTCPADASREVLSVAKYVSPYPGGAGCVRDVVEQVLRLQGKWPLVAEERL